MSSVSRSLYFLNLLAAFYRLMQNAFLLAQLFLNSEKLVILRHTLTSAGRARLNLARIKSHRKVCNGRVLRLTRTMGSDRRISGLVSHLDGL